MDKPITTLLFDFDGTLLDTNELIIETFLYVLGKHFPGKYEREHVLPFIGPTLRESFSTVDEAMAEALIQEYRAYNIENHDLLSKEFDGVTETLKALKERGLKMAIVSTKRNDMIKRGLRLMGIEDLFDTVVGLDDVKLPKPDPEPILLALSRLDADAEEALMIGDNHHDIIGGQNAGVRTAAVAWSLKGEEFMASLHPDFMLHHISDLLKMTAGETV